MRPPSVKRCVLVDISKDGALLNPGFTTFGLPVRKRGAMILAK
jgi:hypothetical protein